jgi:hypothetical protein
MKNIIKLILGLVMVSCGDSETSLLGKLDVKPMVNPETRVLLEGNKLFPFITESGDILGLANNRGFHTANNFQNFQVFAQAPSLEGQHIEHKLLKSGMLASYSYNNTGWNSRSTLLLSGNNGRSWEAFDFEVNLTQERPSTYFNMSEKAVLIHDSKAIAAYQRWPEYNYYQSVRIPVIELYGLNPKTGESQKIATFENFGHADVSFLDENNGCLKMSKLTTPYSTSPHQGYDNTYLSFTSDGGHTWTEPVLVDNSRRLHRIFMVNNTSAIIQSSERMYFTNDRGKTLHNILGQFYNRTIEDLQFLDDKTGYALSGNMLYSSFDGGQNWKSVYLFDAAHQGLTNLQFLKDKKQGIVSGNQMLYLTKDGGFTWQVLLFPYAYVI